MRLAADESVAQFRAGFEAWLDEHLPQADAIEADPRRSSSHLPGWARTFQREMYEAGYLVPGWPPELGGCNATAEEQMAYFEVIAERMAPRSLNPQGINICAASIVEFGTDAQKERFVAPTLKGEITWCVGMSEPNAGSDLASLTTRAERDGDHWVVNGQKVWTSYAHIARWGILLARTDAAATKHSGIGYFVCPMDAPGIEIRPLIDMTGEHAFNEVFLSDVRIPADHLVGPEHAGWELAKVTLGNERVSLSGEGALWGMGPTAEDLVGLVRDAGGAPDPFTRRRLVDVYVEAQILRVLRLRMVSAVLAGRAPGPEASVRKAIADAHGQHIMDLGRDLAGPHAMLAGTGPVGGWGRSHPSRATPADPSASPASPPPVDPTWSRGFLFAPALTVGGGTAEVQRNIVAEKVLGLPRDP